MYPVGWLSSPFELLMGDLSRWLPALWRFFEEVVCVWYFASFLGIRIVRRRRRRRVVLCRVECGELAMLGEELC